MGVREWWAARIEQWRQQRAAQAELQLKRKGRVRVTWRNCDGCRHYGFQMGTSGLCERCLRRRQQTP